MRPVATSLFTPAIERPLTAVIRSPVADARLLGRRALEHAQDLEPAAVLLDVHSHALELAAHGLLELLRLVGSEVVRELVAERLHNPLERGFVELVLVDRLVEALLDRLDDLGPQRPVPADERIADRSRQGLRVATEPDAHEQREHRAQEGDDCGTGRLHRPPRVVAVAKRAGNGAG
jgi:hypothetical protein